MENFSAVKTEGQAIKLVVRPEFEKELPELDAERYKYLATAIKRDGVLDSIKFRRCPDTGKCEIIDGHHRFKIANELGLPYDVEEIVFDNPSITNVLYWMHVFNAARRGSNRNAKRMDALKDIMAKEQGRTISKAQKVREIAQDTGTSERGIYKALAKKTKPSPFEYLAKIIARTLKDLSAEEREQLKAMFQ